MSSRNSLKVVISVAMLVAVGLSLLAFGQAPARKTKPAPTPRIQRPGSGTPVKNKKGDDESRRSVPRAGDGRELAQQRSNERYTALPMVVQPRHKPLAPLDVADERAAINELAELASFEYVRDGDAFSTTMGVGRGAQLLPIDGMEQLERTLRFDRLLQSPDPAFRELVKQVRSITEDVYRLNRANRDFGMVAGLEESLRFRTAIFGGLAEISRWNSLENARAQATTVERLPDGRTVERFDEARFHELADNLDERPAFATGVFQSAADKSRASVNDEIERRRLVARQTDAIRGVLQERMAELWRTRLLPRVEKLAGPAAMQPLIEIGPPAASASRDTPPPRYGEIQFRNRSGRPLDHMTLAVKLSDQAGQETQWYVHLPRMESQKIYRMVYPNGPRNVVRGAADRIDGSYTVLTAAGKAVDQPLDLDAAAPKTPRTAEQRERAAQAIATNRVEDDKRRSEEKEVLAQARHLYPAARNPEAARDRLIAALQKARRYSAQFDSQSKQPPATIEIEPFEARAAEVKATLQLGAAGNKESIALMGRFADEADRGCVLGFIPVEGESHETKLAHEMQERLANMPAKYNNPDLAKKLAAPAAATAKLRLSRWQKGGLPLFTAPSEFLSDWDPQQLMIGGKQSNDVQSAITQFMSKRRQFEFACDVVWVDENNRLWLQHMPQAGLRSEITYAPLRPE